MARQGLRRKPVWKVVAEGRTVAAGLTRDRARHRAMDLRQRGVDAHTVAAPPPVIQVERQQLREVAHALLG